MKKLYLMFTLLIVVILLLVGCPKEDKQVTLIAHFISGSPADLQMVEDKVNEYISEKYNIRIHMIYTDYGDFGPKSNLILSSGEYYDIIFTSSWVNNYLDKSRKGAFLDITDYLKTDEFSDLYTAIDEGFWNGARIDGKIYAVPAQLINAVMPMYRFNKRLVEEMNFDYKSVKTLKDAEPYLAYVKQNHPDVVPYFVSKNDFLKIPYDYVLGFNMPILVDGNQKVRFMFEMPDLLNDLKTRREFFLLGYINKNSATDGLLMKGKQFAMSLGSGQPYADVIWSQELGYEVAIIEASKPIATTQSTRGSMMAINSNAKYPKEALIFLQALNTDSILHNMINYGIEGVHYEMVNDSQIKRTERGNNYMVPSFALGNLFNTYTLSDSPKNKWEVFKKVNANTMKSKLLGFNVNIESLKNEIAAIDNLNDQYEPVIAAGAVDIDTSIAEYKQKLLEVGLQKVIDEVQKQVDDFMKKNH